MSEITWGSSWVFYAGILGQLANCNPIILQMKKLGLDLRSYNSGKQI